MTSKSITVEASEVAPQSRWTSLLNWLVILTVIGVLALQTKGGVAARVDQLGSNAFPNWMWRIYDYKVWPLTLLPRGAKR